MVPGPVSECERLLNLIRIGFLPITDEHLILLTQGRDRYRELSAALANDCDFISGDGEDPRCDFLSRFVGEFAETFIGTRVIG